MRRLIMSLGLSAALVTAGCLQKDTTSTIYIGDDGRIEWVVVDTQVRSDESDAAKRWSEEHQFINDIWAGQDKITKGFKALGATNVRVQVLRDRVPYDVMRSASFENLGVLFVREFTRCGVPHRSELKTTGTVTTWTLAFQVEPEPPDVDGCDKDSAFDWLSDAFEHLDIVLESGRFTEAVGFKTLAPDKVTLEEMTSETIKENNGWVIVSLTWDRNAH